MLSANEKIMNASRVHGHLVQRYAGHEAQKAVKLFNGKVLPELRSQLANRLIKIKERGYDTGPATTKRIRQMIKEVEGAIKNGFDKIRIPLNKDFAQFAKIESQWQVKNLRDNTPPIIDYYLPSSAMLETILSDRPIAGRLYADFWNDLSELTQRKITEQIRLGIAEGQTNLDIIRRLEGRAEQAFSDGAYYSVRKNIEAFVRTTTNHVANQASEIVYQENSDVIAEEMWDSVLDNRTCIECASLDGKRFPLGEGKMPPLHIQCRCGRVPITKSWEELGIPLKEMPSGMRASMNGEVPETTTYFEWLEGQPKNIQDEVLGQGRARLWHERKISVKSFTDADNSPIPLKEILKSIGQK